MATFVVFIIILFTIGVVYPILNFIFKWEK